MFKVESQFKNCSVLSTTKAAQPQHVLTPTGNNPLICPVCKETFSLGSRLQRHHFLQCGRMLRAGITRQDALARQSRERHLALYKRRRYLCDDDDVSLPGRPYLCHICHKEFSRIKIQKHLIIHYGEKPHVCDTCGRPFPNRSSLKRHLIIHTAEKSYVCEVCRKVFNQKANHDAHALTHKFEKCAIKSDFDEHYENGRAH